MNRDDICAQCAHLKTKGYPELMAAGKGRCAGYDTFLTKPKNLDVSWNTKACIWFVKDRATREARERWIEKRRAIDQNNNDAQAETKG
jgi:hypothetical protein